MPGTRPWWRLNTVLRFSPCVFVGPDLHLHDDSLVTLCVCLHHMKTVVLLLQTGSDCPHSSIIDPSCLLLLSHRHVMKVHPVQLWIVTHPTSTIGLSYYLEQSEQSARSSNVQQSVPTPCCWQRHDGHNTFTCSVVGDPGTPCQSQSMPHHSQTPISHCIIECQDWSMQ